MRQSSGEGWGRTGGAGLVRQGWWGRAGGPELQHWLDGLLYEMPLVAYWADLCPLWALITCHEIKGQVAL